jgi:hypothetical protein
VDAGRKTCKIREAQWTNRRVPVPQLSYSEVAMRTVGKALMVLLSVFALIFGPSCVLARNAYIQKGERAADLNAWLELDESEHLSLALMGCRKTARKLNVSMGLFVNDSKIVSSELEKLRNRELDDKVDLLLCINRICEERTWQFLASEFGKAFFANIPIEQKRGPVNAIRVIIPNESRRYQYLGDVDDVLRKICRR